MTLVPLRLPLIALAACFAACGRTETETPAVHPVAETAVPEAHAEGGAHDGEEAAPESGGAAHVHGLADLAVTRDGDRFLGELIAPITNFGLAESDGALTDVVIAELSGLVELEGGECDSSPPHPMSDTGGGHTDAIVHFVWTCARPDDVTAIRFAGFNAFSGFETVRTIYLTGGEQNVADLTASSRELALP